MIVALAALALLALAAVAIVFWRALRLERLTRAAAAATPSPTAPDALPVFAAEPARHLGTLFAWRSERFLAAGFGAIGEGTLDLRADAIEFRSPAGAFVIPLADLDDTALGSEHAGQSAVPSSVLKLVFRRGSAQLISGFALDGRAGAERWRRELQVRTGKFLFKLPQ